MHGVKRLFSWMIPRFDGERFNVSLLSLRKKDLSEETLDALGIDITYLERSKFDPTTLPALLRIIDRKQIDILHLHGYGATTFGRLAGALRGIPTIVHEHANLTDTPWFQSLLTYDPAKVLKDVKQPLLFVHGELDKQVPVAHADRLADLARKQSDSKSVDVVVVRGVNHLLVPAITGEISEYASLPDRNVSKNVSGTLTAWLTKTFAAIK